LISQPQAISTSFGVCHCMRASSAGSTQARRAKTAPEQTGTRYVVVRAISTKQILLKCGASLGSAREVCPCSGDSATIRIKVGIRPRTAVGFGSRAAVAVATADFCSSIRKRSSKAHQHPSGGLPGLPVPQLRRQHPQRRDQNPLRLFLPHRPAVPALSDRPLAHAALQTHDVPHAAPGRPDMPPSACIADGRPQPPWQKEAPRRCGASDASLPQGLCRCVRKPLDRLVRALLEWLEAAAGHLARDFNALRCSRADPLEAGTGELVLHSERLLPAAALRK
jgi:hypothetical protein